MLDTDSIDSIFVYSVEIAVRWSDMDAFGHVNNSVFFTYFEQARIEWWYSILPVNTPLHKEGPVIVTANCTFLKPIIAPETLIVRLFVGPPGKSSYDCFYIVQSKLNEEIKYAEGNTKVVWVNRAQGRSMALPEYMRKCLPKNKS